MSKFTNDPNLCSHCQKLGYCAVRAKQAEAEANASRRAAEHLDWQRQTSFQSPMLSADPEPMPSFREFVAVHRPDLSKYLPRLDNAKADLGPTSTPSLAELRARIAARKLPQPPKLELQTRKTSMPLGSIVCHLGNPSRKNSAIQIHPKRRDKKQYSGAKKQDHSPSETASFDGNI